MKIILEAFGKLKSEPIDVPENTTTIFRLALSQPIQAIKDYQGNTFKENPPIETICEFEWSGGIYHINGQSVRRYVLSDIIKQ